MSELQERLQAVVKDAHARIARLSGEH